MNLFEWFSSQFGNDKEGRRNLSCVLDKHVSLESWENDFMKLYFNIKGIIEIASCSGKEVIIKEN